jgi:hypothetical protein
MLKKGIAIIILALWVTTSWSQTAISNKDIRTVYQAEGTNKKLQDTAAYYLIRFKDPGLGNFEKFHPVKRLSHNYYVVASRTGIPADNNITETAPANALWKAADNLVLLWQKHPHSNTAIEVVVTINNTIANNLEPYGTVTLQAGSVITLKTTLHNLPGLLSEPNVVFANIQRKPHEELAIDDMDLGVNNIAAISHTYPNINGNGINVAVKENKYDNDLDLLSRTFTSFNASNITSSHATTMATLIGGNGNSFIKGLGVAPQVKFTSSDFARLLPDDDKVFIAHHISVQNHSYGTGIENYYGAESVAYDQQVLLLDTLVHVFSSGNIGTSAPATGVYAALKGIANLSGDFKQAKNVLVIGGIGRNNVAQDLSSGGPAYDGRIKPELVANGEDGTSGAAAIVSGTVALLQQAYQLKYHQLPSSALVKAMLINSATDIGTQAVDYKTGYGKLNALEALRTLNEQRFNKGTVTQQQQTNFTVTVPANCREFKVTLAWNDAPAALNAPLALVNDLDLSVISPGGNTLLPWALSTFPLLDSLLKPAQRHRDTLNNVEQVTLQNPAAGTYTIHIKGSKVPTGMQTFYIAHQAVKADQFEWIYPSGADQLFANGDNYLRWQSSFNASTGKLSVSYNHGDTWQAITNVNFSSDFYVWAAPDVFSTAMLKMEFNGQVHISKEFIISKPLTLNVGYNCTDGTLLHWNAQPGSIGYVVYTIKDNLLQKLTTATDTTVLIPAQQQTSPYFAVSALGGRFEGVKSYTINAATQGVGCYIKTLLANVEGKTVVLNLQLGSILNLKAITWQKQTGTDTYTNIGTTTINGTALSYQFVDANPKKGTQYYRVMFTTTNNQIIYTDLASADYLQANQFVVYPNPVNTQVNILSGEINNYEFKLYDMGGKLSLSKSITELQNTIPLSISPGVYIYVITLNGKIIHRGKLIKV